RLEPEADVEWRQAHAVTIWPTQRLAAANRALNRPVTSRLILANSISCNLVLAGGRPNAIRSIETARVHRAGRRRGGRVAARRACGGTELSRPTRARDRSLRAGRSDRCDHAPARTKTVGTRGKAVLRREYGWWRRQYCHGPSGKNGARWLHAAHDQSELCGQSHAIRQGPLSL